MHKQRLEAYSDAVVAIIVTIIVLEFKVPHGASFDSLASLAPTFGAYVLSFVYLAVFWNNHHHMLQAVKGVNGIALWANNHFLFWLSLLPFASAWMGENHFAPTPTAFYGLILLFASGAFHILQVVLCKYDHEGLLQKAMAHDRRSKVTMILLPCAITMAFHWEVLAQIFYGYIALLWLVPNRRIEATLEQNNEK